MSVPSYHSFPLNNLVPLIKGKRPFIFLDTARPGPDNRFSYVFTDPRSVISAQSIDDIPLLLKQLDNHEKKSWTAGYLTYEASYGLEQRLSKLAERTAGFPEYRGWFGVFDTPYIFDHERGKWNRPLPSPPHFRGPFKQVPAIRHAITESSYKNKLQSIKRFIARGHTYQINFTYDVLLQTGCDEFDLYRQMRENQKTAYCSFISLDGLCVASFSPELFFRKNGRTIFVKPMKGTAARGRFQEEDSAMSEALLLDAKNRSENVMIVDLMRNDLGRICRIGSVKTPELFKVETLPTVLQMTSTVKGILKPTITSGQILKSLLPSGSVTGAPKIRSMEIISKLESGNRGVYCGAIGFISPRGEAEFSVPIRTLQSTGKKGLWKYRVGGAIVWDSKASEEWRECAIKTSFLTKQKPVFEIFESILWNNRLVYKKDHISRLMRSARYFDYPLDPTSLISPLTGVEKKLLNHPRQKVRVFLDKNGKIRWDHSALIGNNFSRPAPIIISPIPVDEHDPLMFHKTTIRPWYDEASKVITQGLYFDVIFKNSKGEITEGGRSNIFIQKGKMLYTPPVTCGLLPGVLRASLIKRGKCQELILKQRDIEKADAIFCGNSVRGLVQVRLKSNKIKKPNVPYFIEI
jgi:para-aminobenzoate synthetase/4-amino-4-deoxychorismate lyase